MTSSYPYFVSYVCQIGPQWWYSYNYDLLSNLGVPGYSNHPYNVLNFAFWISSTNTAAVGTAPDVWLNLATYITDITLRQTLTGKTNPSSTELRQTIKQIYASNGIKIIISAVGANDHPVGAGLDPTVVATNLANYAQTYLYDGVDIDWEEGSYFMGANAGTGEQWLATLTNTINNILNPTSRNYLITHAPQAPYFMGSTLNQYPQGGYLNVHNTVGNKIDFYNVQFYNQGSTTYSTYTNIFQSSIGWSGNSAVYQMINGQNPEQISIPANKIVIGKHSLGDGNDYVDGSTLKNIFNQALAAQVWNAGFMCWQFYTENTQNPPFQLANEAANANWDFNVSPAPITPTTTTTSVPTVPTIVTIPNPSGCVNGNICVKVKGFALIPSPSTPVWWWSIYDDDIINSLRNGCTITDCTCIKVKQSNTNTWITGYNENNDCSFQMGDNPFISTTISVDFRITTSNGKVIQVTGVVQDTTANKQWDFGSNFESCDVTTSHAPTTTSTTPSHTTTSTTTTTTSTTSIIITNQASTQSYWVAFFIEHIDLTCGGSITNVEITDNNHYSGTWIGYDDNQYGYYSFPTNGNAFTEPISVRITKSYNGSDESIVGQNLVDLTGDKTFDFGYNFCGINAATTTNDNTYENIVGGKDTMTQLLIGLIISLGLMILQIIMIVICVCKRRKKQVYENNKFDKPEMIFTSTLKMYKKDDASDGGVNTETMVASNENDCDDNDGLFIN